MRKPSPKLWGERRCASCRSRVTISWICSPCTACEIAGSGAGHQLRGLLLERGITFRKGRRHAEASLPGILEDGENGLSGPLRMLLAQLQCELRQLQSQIDEADTLIAKAAGNHEPCRRLMVIPGVGPLTATAIRSRHRQRRGVSEGALICRMAGTGTRAAFERRKAKAARDQQAWKLLSATTSRARSPRSAAVQGQAAVRPQCLAG